MSTTKIGLRRRCFTAASSGTFADYRQRTAGGGDQDVVVGEVGRHIGQLQGQSIVARCQGFGVGQGSVGNGQLCHPFFREVLGDPLNGIARSEEHGLGVLEAREYLLGHGDSGIGDRDRIPADVGVGANLFGRRQGDLGQEVQLRPHSPRGSGQIVGRFYLAHDLRLAENLGVQPRSHPDQMPGGVLVPVAVGHRVQFRRGNRPRVGEPGHHAALFAGVH